MTKKISEGPLAINGSQPCCMGDREREEDQGWWSAVDARGMVVGRARLGTPKWRRRPVSSMIIRGSYPRLSSSDTPSRLLLGLKRHAYSVLAFFAQEMITT